MILIVTVLERGKSRHNGLQSSFSLNVLGWRLRRRHSPRLGISRSSAQPPYWQYTGSPMKSPFKGRLNIRRTAGSTMIQTDTGTQVGKIWIFSSCLELGVCFIYFVVWYINTIFINFIISAAHPIVSASPTTTTIISETTILAVLMHFFWIMNILWSLPCHKYPENIQPTLLRMDQELKTVNNMNKAKDIWQKMILN